MKMSKTEFKALVDVIVETYGVRSYLDNVTDDMTDEEINDDLWFECPECSEPILYEDYADELVMDEDDEGIEFISCPICEERIDF